MRFRAASAGELLVVPLDTLAAVYHRPSGTTHLLAEPAPQILDALGSATLDLDGLVAALDARFALGGEAREALAARLDELVAAGLVGAA